MLGKYKEYEKVVSISYVVRGQQKHGEQLHSPEKKILLHSAMLPTSFVSLPVTFLEFIISH